MAKPTTIDDYIANLSENQRAVASIVRKTILKALPDLTETIRYNIPAFQLKSATVIYFAVWKDHVGLYPIYSGTPEFEIEIAPFRAKKDTVQFLHNHPIPTELITKIVASQFAKLETAQTGKQH